MLVDGPSPGDIILVDANVIIEADKVRIWKAISATFKLHTVESVVKEALHTPIGKVGLSMSEADLRKSFAVIYDVSEDETAEFVLSYDGLMDRALDGGELDLLTYLHLHIDVKVWFLCGPDVGSMKGLHCMELLDHLVSLEKLQQMCGLTKLLPNHFKQGWQETTVYQIKEGMR